jgi:hypothetical protein
VRGVAEFDALEPRCLLSAALDVVGITAMRNDPAFAGIDGSGVTVAVLDTGVDLSHPLLQPGVVAGFNAVTGGADPTPNDPHGTHVTGIVGARDPNIGAAPGVGLIGIQVFRSTGNGGISAYNPDIESALQWVLDHRAQYNIVAINMSLGHGNFGSAGEVNGDSTIDDVQRLEAAGVTVVSAAGNSFFQYKQTGSGSPAVFSTLAVGAVWETNEGGPMEWGSGAVDFTTGPDRVTSFSQRSGQGNVIFAPGAVISSTFPGGEIADESGTSQASPLVAGVVALMQEAAMQFGGRLLTPTEVRQIMLQTADHIVDGDDENTNVPATGATFPRVNAYRAVQLIRDTFTGTPGPDPDPGPGPGPDVDPDDPNGTLASAIAGPSLAGEAVPSVAGVIGSDGTNPVGATDVDLVRFEVLAPGTVTVTAAAAGGSDPFLRIFDAAGNQLAADDDSAGSLSARVSGTLPAGTYYAGVSGAGNTGYNPTVAGSGTAAAANTLGDFTLTFTLSSADPNGLISGAVDLNLNETNQVLPGLIGSDFGVPVGSSDVDIFRIVVPDDGTLFVDVDTPFASGFVDSWLRVFDENGTELVISDDAMAPDESVDPTDSDIVIDSSGAQVGHRTDSYVGGTVTRGDVYYIAISDFDNSDYDPTTLAGRSPVGPGGNYNLDVTFINRDLNGSVEQADVATSLPAAGDEQIGVDEFADGTTQEVGDRDVDVVRVNSPTAGILDAVVSAHTLTGNAAPVDTVLRLFDAQGNLLSFNDDTNGLDPVLRYEIAAGVDYYVAVCGFGNDNFDPFILGSGSSGETGSYHLDLGLRPLADVTALGDDAASWGGVTNVALGFRNGGTVGHDRGFARRQTDVDIYRFQATGSGPVTIRATPGDEFGADPFLRLFDANGAEIAFDDNGLGATRGALINANVTPGTYFIGVSGAGPGARSYDPFTGAGAAAGSTGDYTLSVTGNLGLSEGPDFQVSGVVPKIKPGAVIGGQTKGSATVLVTNIGNRPSTGPASVRLVLSADGAIDANDTQVTVTPAKPLRLRPGQTKRVKAKFVIPAIADGNYFLLAEADAALQTAEMNEGNNVGSSAVAIPIAAPFLDLNVSFGAAPTALVTGQRGQITLMVRNLGNVPAKGVVPVRVLASLDGALDAGDGVLASLPAVKLNIKPGATKAVKLKFNVGGVAPGTYFYIASIDSTPIVDRNPSDNLAVSPTQFVLS